MTGPSVLRVAGAAPYDVVVGNGLTDRLAPMLGSAVRRVAVIHSPALTATADGVARRLAADGLEPLLLEVPDGERAKSVEVAARCWQALGRAGFTRSDAIVTVGGGATTDVGGFVAATWLRGVKVVHLPTTLLGMVDAAVGGKTGIDTDEGKNLVGAFHEPGGVLCDLDALASLPREELASGLGEVVKCGFVADPRIIEIVEADPQSAVDHTSAALRELVERAIRVKVDVVVADLKETGGSDGHPGREVLNYGHTLGHAIEKAEDYRFRHGEAVAIGMCYVAELARLAGRLDEATARRHRSVLELVGLPTTYRGADWPQLHETMRVDKKTRGDRLRFVVLDGLARPAVLTAPKPDLLVEAFAAVTGTDERGVG